MDRPSTRSVLLLVGGLVGVVALVALAVALARSYDSMDMVSGLGTALLAIPVSAVLLLVAGLAGLYLTRSRR